MLHPVITGAAMIHQRAVLLLMPAQCQRKASVHDLVPTEGVKGAANLQHPWGHIPKAAHGRFTAKKEVFMDPKSNLSICPAIVYHPSVQFVDVFLEQCRPPWVWAACQMCVTFWSTEAIRASVVFQSIDPGHVASCRIDPDGLFGVPNTKHCRFPGEGVPQINQSTCQTSWNSILAPLY